MNSSATPYHTLSATSQQFLDNQPKMLIGDKLCYAQDSATAPSVNPANGDVIAQIPMASLADLDAAVHAARAQFDGGEWSDYTPLQREHAIRQLADLIESHADELAELESLDMGKSFLFARDGDIPGSVDTLRYFAGWASKLHGRTCDPAGLTGEFVTYTRKEPVGVVGIIIPWNFPLQTLVWKLAAVLATGCCAVIKPAELTSLSALRLAELIQQTTIPAGVINIVTGKGSVIGEALSSHAGIDKISFTGSTPVGIRVGQTAMAQMKRLTLELGGKSAVIVTADVDIAATAEAVANGVFFNSGQVCDAGTRVYIEQSIYQPFLAALVAFTQTLKIAPGFDPDCYIGPLVSEKQQQSVLDYIQLGHDEGAKCIYQGEIPESTGYFVAPTIFADCHNQMRLVREEIFGPVLCCASFTNDAEVIALANDSDYGLAAAIYGNDLSRVHRLIPKLQAGTVYVNAHGTLDPALPFGGYKQSGFGKDLGAEQLDDLLKTKAVWLSL